MSSKRNTIMEFKGMQKDYPLLDTQMGIYAESVKEPEATYYNIPLLFEMNKTIDVYCLKKAVEASFEMHPILKTKILADEDGFIVQKRQDDENVNVQVITLHDNEYETFVKNARKPFQIKEGNLYRAMILITGSKCSLYLEFHHVITDGYSMGIILKNICENYQSFSKNEKYDLKKEEFTCFDAAIEYEELRKSSAYLQAKKYFETLLSDADIDCLLSPVRFEKNLPEGKEIIKVEQKFFTTTQVEGFCKKNKISKNTLFCCAFGITLKVFNRMEQSTFSTVYHGRDNSNYKDTFGMFVKTLPVVISSETDISKLLQDLHRQIKQTRQHDIYPFSEICREYGMSSDLEFVYQGNTLDRIYDAFADLGGKLRYDILYHSKTAQCPLQFMLYQRKNEKYTAQIMYKSNLYDRNFIEHFATAFMKATKQLMVCQKTDEICLISKEDTEDFNFLNQTEQNTDLEHTILHKFKEQVKNAPERECLCFPNKRYTYKEVDETTDKLAVYLKKTGCKCGDVVSVLIPRNEYILLASLGVLKTGAAYEPLPADYPPERLRFMIKDANAKVVIAAREYANILTDYKGIVLYTDEINKLPNVTLEEISIAPDSVFILLYTSGSTGNPKGVQITHQNVNAFCQNYQYILNLTKNDRVAAYASYGFDAHMMDIYPAITCGACVSIIPEEIRLDLMKMNQFFCTQRITIAFMTTQVGRLFQQIVTAPSLRHLISGGEEMISVKPRADFTFWNFYGPTECTVFILQYKVVKEMKKVPIGLPIKNVKLYVVDQNKRPLPAGAIGELLCAGPQVSLGYLNNEEKTKEVFINNPFSKETGYEKVYCTGDLVRYLSDGTIEFMGRKDSQIKIRGFRIELAEVESVIREFSGIKDVVVVANYKKDAGKYLVAYVVSDEPIDTIKLAQFIKKSKPSYMVPAVIMQIPNIPLTQNQKVNKKALPKPVITHEKELAMPENETQRTILQLIKEVKQIDKISITANLLESVMTSIEAMRFIILFSKKFHVNFKMAEFKDVQTVKQLENYLNNEKKSTDNIVYVKRESYPITQTQMGILTECMAHPNTTIYNIPMLYKLPKTIQLSKLIQACKRTVNTHPYIKSVLFMDANEKICMQRKEEAEPIVEVLKGKPDFTQIVQPFPLIEEPLYRIKIMDSNEYIYLFLDFHHMICDGASLEIIFNDIEQAYLGKQLKKETYSGFEIALEEERLLTTHAFTKAKEYYNDLLGGCETDYLPQTNSTETISKRGVCIHTTELKRHCEEFCKINDITMNAFFMTAFGYLIGTYKYKEDALFTTIYNGRTDSRMERTVDMLVKTLPVYLHYNKRESIVSLLRQTAKQLVNSMANDIFPFSQIRSDYGIRSDIMFIYQGDTFNLKTFAGQKMEILELELDLDVSKVPLSVQVRIKEEKLYFQCEYRTELYTKERIKNILESFEQVIQEFLKKEYINEISMVSEKQWNILKSWNQTEVKIETVTANILLERQVERNADKIAVIAQDHKITFRELNERANRIAWGLIQNGVKEEQIVALMLPRTAAVYEVREAILKAGGAFLYIDPSYAEERIDYILENSKAACLITTKNLLEEHKKLRSQETRNILFYHSLLETKQKDNPKPLITPDSPAYCIYTSGSTGKPKGVLLSHRNLVNFVHNNKKNLLIKNFTDYATVSLALTAFTFDVSVLEECGLLYNQKTVCIANQEEIRNPLLLAKLIQKYQINVVISTPAFLTSILDIEEMKSALKQIKVYNIGGEDFSKVLLHKIKQVREDAIVINVYGPTETTIGCTGEILEEGNEITIGTPFANTEIYMVDQNQKILPAGVPGEMAIVGDCVGKGYIGMPEVTKEKFITILGKTAYLSGDMAMWNMDGKITFLGRMDRQVKLRGLRVELGEIESVINHYKGMKASTVLVREKGENQYLCAYYMTSQPVSKEDLQQYMRKYLTDYMLPNVLMEVEHFPLTNNGKIDQKALPDPVIEKKNNELIKPQTKLEEMLYHTFSLVLGTQKLSITDDFFEIGGTSLLASKVVMKCMNDGLPILYADIFKYKTILKLEACIINKLTQEHAIRFEHSDDS